MTRPGRRPHVTFPITLLLLASLLLSPRTAGAHDLAETGATVVVREGGHVTLQLNITWSRILQARWRPDRPRQEYLAYATTLPPAAFAREVLEVQRIVTREVNVQLTASAPQAFIHWTWPAPAEIQAALQHELMALVVDGAGDHHASRLGATAELRLRAPSPDVRIRFPAVLGKVLLTVSAPSEAWLGTAEWSRPFRTTVRP